MSEHTATISWTRKTGSFEYDTYSRDHTWTFGDVIVPASSAPEFLGSAENVDPEEAFVAALSSCHMLTFLAIAARRRLIVDRYTDHAVGYLEKNKDGKLAVTRVILQPEITFGDGTAPDAAALDKLHHRAHDECYIANSVRTEILIR